MKIEWKNCFKIGLSVFILYLCIHYLSNIAGLISAVIGAAAPLTAGCIIAYLINILMSFYERHYFPKSGKSVVAKSRRAVCMLAAVFTLLAVIALVIGLVVPQFISCIQLLIEKLPAAMESIVAFLENLGIVPEDIINYLNEIDWKSIVTNLIDTFKSGIGDVLGTVVSTVSSVFSGVVTVVMGFIFAIYVLMSKDKLKQQCDRIMRRYVKKQWYEKLLHVLSVANDSFRRYITGQCTEAVILGSLCALGMFILRLPYAAMIGALVAFTALIPIAGAYIAAAIGAVMILTVSPTKALIFLIFLVLLQQFEGNIIYPRVVGSSIGLPGIWVFSAVTVGGGIMGVLGMLLGVPLAATVYKLLREDLHKGDDTQCPEGEAAKAPEDNSEGDLSKDCMPEEATATE